MAPPNGNLAQKEAGGHTDLEANSEGGRHLMNDLVANFSWYDLTVTAKDRRSKKASESTGRAADIDKIQLQRPGMWQVFFVLLQRAWVKAIRDAMAYGIRIVMYFGLAILMGTVFFRFGDNQKYIQPFTNALFFGGAFMSFMAVAYVPAFLEDRATFIAERANGLVDGFLFTTANFVI
ncbi:hypothetical protein BDY17DRAFT_314217 [Neohortaea acidophila]|uniref:ABC-2 type transporter transmembrane domain-containing protein n=1 Tax=Neohortaea acidophila TaxID=245834 RepID=A0A6A6PEW7_9PEZI|nr:uncharacterized protein BDY17DRAFT_314217 [Neohortaea acidophila]KAF2478470.1 hypothetical protein BDY17DRAFT_314217 [Neohortaea acidophila]